MARGMVGALALMIVLAACDAGPAEPNAASGPPRGPSQTRDTGPEPVTRSPSGGMARAENSGGTGSRLPGWFDCLREAGGLVIAAHRGGPAPGFPENALETLQRGAARGLVMFEVDVAESRDGVLLLMHDRDLARTTTGAGRVDETAWADIASLRLVDADGQTSDFSVPTLGETLRWAKGAGVILELDAKPSASYRKMVAAVRAAGAEDHVVLISYTHAQAGALARYAPDLVITADARNQDDLDALGERGLSRGQIVAWTGIEAPDPAAWDRLARAGVEAGFGTLGGLDERYLADGDGAEFRALAEDGLVLLATDAPLEAAEALKADDRAATACPR